MKEKEFCRHLDIISNVNVGTDGVCEECIKHNGTWVHLRTCQQCGATLCCDSSPARHASEHYRLTGHPVIASAESGERWLYCYEDNRMKRY